MLNSSVGTLPQCKMQGCIAVGTTQHELLHCSKNDSVGINLLSCLQEYVPGLQADAALRLEHGDLEDDMSLPLTLLTAIILNTVWKERQAGRPIRSYKVRAELEQSINLLRTTRFSKTTSTLSDMKQLMF